MDRRNPKFYQLGNIRGGNGHTRGRVSDHARDQRRSKGSRRARAKMGDAAGLSILADLRRLETIRKSSRSDQKQGLREAGKSWYLLLGSRKPGDIQRGKFEFATLRTYVRYLRIKIGRGGNLAPISILRASARASPTEPPGPNPKSCGQRGAAPHPPH